MNSLRAISKNISLAKQTQRSFSTPATQSQSYQTSGGSSLMQRLTAFFAGVGVAGTACGFMINA